MTTQRRGFRADGLDNPCSPNSGGATWDLVEELCEESGAVASREWDGDELVIVWCDGNESRHSDPQAALNEIREMDAN